MPHTASLETIVIRPRRGLSPIDLKLIWQFRDLLIAFADRDIRLRYRQTVLGVTWVLLQPLLGAGIFSVVFGLIAKMPDQGLPYFLISYSGFLGWTLFQGVVTRVSPSLVANAPLIRKVFFPRLLIPLGVLPSVLLDFSVSLVLMIGLMIIFGVTAGWPLLLAPVCVLILLFMSLGIGLIATSLAVKHRDVSHIVPFGIQLLMYASPVGYSIAAIPLKVQPYYFLINPIAAPIEMIRWSFLNTTRPEFGYLAYSAIAAAVSMLIGLLVFHSVEREFADVI